VGAAISSFAMIALKVVDTAGAEGYFANPG